MGLRSLCLRWRRWLWAGSAACAAWAACGLAAAAALQLPTQPLQASDLAVIVNTADPDSLALGRYYARKRGIPASQVLQLSLPADQSAIGRQQFEDAMAQLSGQVPAHVQAFAIAWTRPYRVECMSITSAFAFGFDPALCAEGCKPTRNSPYYNSDSQAPYRELGLRPAMLLAGSDLAQAKALVDRGVRSDDRWPAGRAYLVSSSDKRRDVRAASHARAMQLLATAYPIEEVHADSLRNRRDVMFQFIGVERLAGLDSLRFLDGAVADHLTSAGGMLVDSPQSSALEWLQAGATGSYGTVQEPCNIRAKFPDIPVLMGRYLLGETLIEAYWKSVQMPGQGVFIGEPLARPFGGQRRKREGDAIAVETRSLAPGRYLLQAADQALGPYRTVGRLQVDRIGVHGLRLPVAGPGPGTGPLHHRLVPESEARAP